MQLLEMLAALLRRKKMRLILSLLILFSVQGMSVERGKNLVEFKEPAKAVVEQPDCKPGQSNTNGDNVGTKVVCSCEPTKCDTPKPVKCEPKTVTKTVTKTVDKVVEKPVEKIVEKFTPYPVDKIVEKEVSYGGIYVDLLFGLAPDGVHVYRYEEEYRGRVGDGIVAGALAGYEWANGARLGGLYINNDTRAVTAGFKFKIK